MKKNIAIITPGGDASGINTCIRSLVRSGIYYGFEMHGILRGYDGLLKEQIIHLEKRSVSNIIHKGGTILKSARCSEIRTEEGLNKASRILKKNKMDWLMVLGGDGSFCAAHRIARKSGIPVTGIPVTIDNDVYGTDETIGFDTACDVAIEAIDKIRDTAVSFERVFIVEVMGREHGFLAVTVGLSSGAEFIVIPETGCDTEAICRELLKDKKNGKTSIIIVFAEGAGNPFKLAEQLTKKTGLEVRVSSLGYIQRGGSPSTRSRILAARFGDHAIKLIRRNVKNHVVVVQNDAIKSLPISKVTGKNKKIDRSLYELAKHLAI